MKVMPPMTGPRLLEIFIGILIGFQLLHALPQLENDGARAKGIGIFIFHDSVLFRGPSALRKNGGDLDDIVCHRIFDLDREILHDRVRCGYLICSAASAFTISRYLSIASLPEKPLVL